MAAFLKINIQKLCLMVSFIAIGNFVSAQQIIRGRILQLEGDQPLPGATVTVKTTKQSQTTNANYRCLKKLYLM